MSATIAALALAPMLARFQSGLTLDVYLDPIYGTPIHTCTLSWVEERGQYESSLADGAWVLRSNADGSVWGLARGDGRGGTYARFGSAVGIYGDERTGLARPPLTPANCRIR